MLYFEGRPSEGLLESVRGVELCRRRDNRYWLRKLLTAQGIFQADLLILPQAIVTFAEAEGLCRDLGDHSGMASVWGNLTAALAYAELPDLTASAARKAVEIAHRLTDSQQRITSCAASLGNVCYVSLSSRRHAVGLKTANEILDLYRQWQRLSVRSSDFNPLVWALNFAYHARLLLRVGLVHEALAWISRAEELRHGPSTRRGALAYVHTTKALCDAYAGRYKQSIAALTEAAATASTANPVMYAEALRDLVEAHTVGRRPDLATRYAREVARTMRDARLAPKLVLDQEAFTSLVAAGHSDRRTPVAHMSLMVQADHVEALNDLCHAAELHEDESGLHPLRVGELAFEISKLAGLGEHSARVVGNAARFHDVGKIGIPPSITAKKGALDEGETQILQRHTDIGAELLACARIKNQSVSIAVAKHHHEWWSGAGYPGRLAGDQIPFEARVTAIAEVFDSMTHSRPYRQRMNLARALSVVAERSGTQFDPDLVPLLAKVVHRILASHGSLDSYLERNARDSSFTRTTRQLLPRGSRG